MTPSQSGQTPLARLVLFMVCLAIAGSILAGAHYFTVDLPQQKAAEIAPDNNAMVPCDCFINCMKGKDRDFKAVFTCKDQCGCW